MFSLKPYPVLLGLAVLIIFARPALAFGAGNIASISKVEGENWRHGDLEDALLAITMARAAGGKKFSKLMVSRVYFGNWLRDYSQAIDVGTVKSVSAEAIRLLLCVLGFMTFGYGSKEFEVTAERLGTYRPEDHIDNPKGYGEGEDARNYDRRLRGPIDEETELAIDERTGMKNYIANDGAGCMTSSKHARKLFRRCIELGRQYKNEGNKDDLYEALRLLGTGLHCLEDFLAHSNYVELALIEMGERDVFPHVGRDTMMELPGASDAVYPCVTGTFGGVDFLHSVTGEVSDKLTQNEIDELEGTLQNTAANNDTSRLEELLDKIPDGIFGGSDDKKGKMHDIQDNAASAQMENTQISPRDPEEFTLYVRQIYQQIMPAMEFHDELLKGISEAMEKIPLLPQIIEQLEEQMSVWVFSIMAPFVVPVLQQVKNELRTGSSEIIESSKNEQHIVFNDDSCTDPTHSMLSKDHFSNVLNEPAGKTASKIVHWVVPQIMEAWDDEDVDIRQTMDRIISGVLHHPAQRGQGRDGAREGRDIMFSSVEEWWNGMSDRGRDEMRYKLSRDGVERGENHKEGVEDSGHGCCKPLGMHKNFAKGGTFEDRIAGAAAGAILEGVTGGISDFVGGQSGGKVDLPEYKDQSGGFGAAFSGGGSSGGGGGFLGKMAGEFLGSALGGGDDDEKESRRERRRQEQSEYGEREQYGGRQEYGERQERQQYGRSEGYGGGEAASYGGGYQQENRSYGGEERREYGGGGGGGYGGGYGGEERGGGGGGYGGGYGGEERREYGGGGGYGGEERREYGGGGGGGYGGSYGGEERRGGGGGYGGGYGGEERREGGGHHGGHHGGHRRRKSNDSNDSDEEKHHRRRRGSNDSNDSDRPRRRRGSNDSNEGHHHRRRGSGNGGGGWGF